MKFGIKYSSDADYTYFSSSQLSITLPSTGSYTLDKTEASTDTFSLLFDRSELQYDAPRFWIQVTATPTSVSVAEVETLYGYVGTCKSAVAGANWLGYIDDENYETIDYDSYNYVIAGNGKGSFYFAWDDSKVKPNEFALQNYSSDIQLGTPASVSSWTNYNQYGTGAPASGTWKYIKLNVDAFRGVIVGASSDGSVKVSMSVPKSSEISNYENTHGLITMSNGCVIKNLTIEVIPYTTDKYNYKVNGNQAYGYDEKFSNYGAVINKIMGGDNIIDNVSVDLIGSFKVVNSNDYKATVGGYVGCVVNGGLIFRNVDDDNLTTTTVSTVNNVENRTSVQGFKVIKVNGSGVQQEVKIGDNVICSSSVDGSMTDEDDLIHIHVNPFVGRVINGYAIRESSTVTQTNDQGQTETIESAHYAFSEDGATYGDGETRANAVEVTMHNTRKNYSIPDIDTTKNFQDDDESVLTFTKEEGESTYNTITVPDSQALYIMSIIAQSGSGCATDDNENYAYNISYCGTSGRNYTGNTADNYKASHLASYSDIGSSTKGTDYNLSKNDTVNSKKAVPYIIYKYTSSYSNSGTKYPARTLTKRTFYVNLVGGTTYYLPDSFRGIGFLGSNNLDDNMKIYGFNGNGTISSPTVIDVNTEFIMNKRGEDPYYGSNINAELWSGISLFNQLTQKNSGIATTYKDTAYESSNTYQITNITLQGFMSVKAVKSSDGSEMYSSHAKTSRNSDYMNVAGFVSNAYSTGADYYNFSNDNLKKFHVKSPAFAGGFLAYCSRGKVYVNNCNADGLTIEGSGRIAGFVGTMDAVNIDDGFHVNTGINSEGKDTFKCELKNVIISNHFTGESKFNYSAGVIGAYYSNKSMPTTTNDCAIGNLIIRNVTIEGGNPEKNYIGNSSLAQGSSGGIVGGGTASIFGCLIINCVVKDIDIYGKYAGGIFGEDANVNSENGTSQSGARIVGCKVTGTLKDGKPQYYIKGERFAGGIYGENRDSRTNQNPRYKSYGETEYTEYKTDIDGVYVYGYNIYCINSGNDNTVNFGVGGITANINSSRYIQNCKIEKCVLETGCNSTSSSNIPISGFVGTMMSGSKIYGYNIEVKDCDFQTHQWVAASTSNGVTTPAHATNVQKAYPYSETVEGVTTSYTPVTDINCGNVVGKGNSNDVNITAIHVENCPAADDFNSTASSSFIIYADYNDVASGNDKGTEMSTLTTLLSSYSNVGEGGLKNYFPNVNVSPVVDMGTNTILTSDGAALYDKVTGSTTTPTPVIDAIVNESGSNYTISDSDVKTYIRNALLSTTVEGQPNKISTYKTEMGSLPDGVDDFTVLVINSETRDYSTALINNYIQMVTNTNYAFMAKQKWSGKYNISVYPCTYDGSKYVIGATGKTAGLNIEEPSGSDGSYRYYMSNTHADSNQGDYQFSLMDVQFYNPNTTLKEVVYHLYIPVLTKKMLLFEFKSASQQGTDNKYANFANYANTLAESLESWYTAYLNFSYGQTEINSMLESGAGLNWNGAKTILFRYQTDTVEAKLSSDTQLVLCDPNNDDKYYYSTLADHRPLTDADGENDTISFADFNTSLTGGSSFTPATLNQMLLAQGFTITASVSETTSENIYVITTKASEADVILSDGTMYKYAGVEKEGTHKINISYLDDNGEPDPSKTLEENYYLAVRAEGNSVYNYSIRTPATTSGGADKPTLRRSNPDEGNVTNIIMGSLYSQIVTINVSNNGTTANEITSANHRLDVELTSMITLAGTSSDKDYIIGHLANPNINLYQSFIIYLTAKDDDGTRSEIRGTPNITTDYFLSGNGHSDTYSNIPKDAVTGTYIQLQHYDMKDYLSKDGTAMITAVTHIDFDEDWKYQAEFPVQDGDQSQIGVNVSAVSNLSYNSDKMRYTNMTKSPTTPSNTYFYIKESDEATLVYNMKSEILDEYDKVGVSSFNYSQQGINSKNFIDSSRDRLPIKTAATYSATKIKRADFINAEKIQFKLKLYKKVDEDGEVKYTEVDDLEKYIDLTTPDSVFIKIDSGVTADSVSGRKMLKTGNNELSYTADINQSLFTRQEDQRITADIDFTVITGEGFTEFANYRFVLSVELLKPKTDDVSQYEPLTNTSYTRDWIVYTNAKINPDMLTLIEYNGS